MIRRWLPVFAWALLGSPALAAEEEPEAEPDEAPASEGDASSEDEDPLSPYRADFEILMDRTIGRASMPVEFNWRDTNVQVAASGSFLFELNNFNSGRLGAMARIPTGGVMLEVGANWVLVGDSESSRLLALTPYRQPGRPDRLEVDFTLGLPVAEGAVTTRPRWMPALQLVFNGYAGVRYAVYPTGWSGMRTAQVLRAIVNPSLTDVELENLEDARLDAMEVDPTRYMLTAGFGNDLYFQQGLFLSPRVMFRVPLLAPITGSRMLFQTDVSLVLGVAF